MATGHARLLVLVVGVVAAALKLLIAANTYGTNDVGYWAEFAGGVRQYGPVGIYGHAFPYDTVYNHPPLAGWMLVVINWFTDHGVASLPFLIRAPASLADIATGVLVFELARLRRPAGEALIAGVLVVCSPVLFVVSGFHGNTDPVFVMFALLAVYLVVVPGRMAAAGAVLAIAMSIKLVPVVIVPALLVFLVRLGWRPLVRFCAGGSAVFLVLWLPVVVSRWSQYRSQVLDYQGGPVRDWGLAQFGTWAELPASWLDWLVGDGRFVVLLVSALIPAAIVWRQPSALVPAVGLGLVLFLLLSPAFGMQYLTWALAAAYLIDTRAATLYNLASSVFVVAIYDQWNNALPWDWNRATGAYLLPRGIFLMVVTWQALAVVAFVGLRFLRRGGESPEQGRPDAAAVAQLRPLAGIERSLSR